jgi:hypothetical protein
VSGSSQGLVAVACLLTAHLLLGVAHISLLPPWEGFDEPGHYASIQQIADAHQLPRLGRAWISTDLTRYAQVAPLPYGSPLPTEADGGMTYRTFFESPSAVARGAEAVTRPPVGPRRYAPSAVHNWEAQHPPLYYILLAPAYLVTAHLSWRGQLFSLRLISYLFAWGALALGCWACLVAMPDVADPNRRSWMAIGIAVWPLMIPSWLPETARLGNDSLCTLLATGVWIMMVRASTSGLTYPRAIGLGSLLGLGCLTKALFVPVTAGALGFWAFRRLTRVGTDTARVHWGPVALAAALVVVIAGWWYGQNWREYGAASGSLEAVLMRQQGGLARRLAHAFSLFEWMRGHAEFLITFVWSGTWSLARPPYIVLIPLVAGVFATVIAYGTALPRLRPATLAWLPVWLALPLIAGFSYHVLLRIAFTGKGVGTPGYYLHFLAVPLASGLGLAMARWGPRSRSRLLVAAVITYAILFAAAMFWTQVLLFAGVLTRAADKSWYQAPAALPPWLGIPEALRRLEALAFPAIGTLAWIAGEVLALLGVVRAWRTPPAAQIPA